MITTTTITLMTGLMLMMLLILLLRMAMFNEYTKHRLFGKELFYALR